MLDSHSLEVISRFKQTVLSQSLPTQVTTFSNRGNKLNLEESSHSLKPKVVEYDGHNQIVLTNDLIEESNYRNKRRWKDYYGRNDENSDGYIDDEEEDEYSEQSDDENPFKKLKLAEILSPLAHPSEIVSHPAISKTFKSQIFAKLSNELIELINVEQTNLNWYNNLLRILNGEDWFYLLDENLALKEYDHGLDDEKHKGTSSIEEDAGDNPENNIDSMKPDQSKFDLSNNNEDGDPFFALPETLKTYERLQAQVDSDDELSVLQEELVNYLQVSIQRQQEYVNNLTELRNGFVRADRLKLDLYKWGKEMHDKKSS